jgi:geranylgeranyl pyrophosphate synthase
MAFQLVDDALDYANDHSDKTSFADLREGKVTLPLVLAVQERPMLMEAVRCIHRGDLAPIAEVRKAVVESGACQETRALAEEYTARAVGVLGEIEPSDARSLLEAIAMQLVARRG